VRFSLSFRSTRTRLLIACQISCSLLKQRFSYRRTPSFLFFNVQPHGGYHELYFHFE